jgi:hypothetical protein
LIRLITDALEIHDGADRRVDLSVEKLEVGPLDALLTRDALDAKPIRSPLRERGQASATFWSSFAVPQSTPRFLIRSGAKKKTGLGPSSSLAPCAICVQWVMPTAALWASRLP